MSSNTYINRKKKAQTKKNVESNADKEQIPSSGDNVRKILPNSRETLISVEELKKRNGSEKALEGKLRTYGQNTSGYFMTHSPYLADILSSTLGSGPLEESRHTPTPKERTELLTLNQTSEILEKILAIAEDGPPIVLTTTNSENLNEDRINASLSSSSKKYSGSNSRENLEEAGGSSRAYLRSNELQERRNKASMTSKRGNVTEELYRSSLGELTRKFSMDVNKYQQEAENSEESNDEDSGEKEAREEKEEEFEDDGPVSPAEESFHKEASLEEASLGEANLDEPNLKEASLEAGDTGKEDGSNDGDVEIALRVDEEDRAETSQNGRRVSFQTEVRTNSKVADPKRVSSDLGLSESSRDRQDISSIDRFSGMDEAVLSFIPQEGRSSHYPYYVNQRLQKNQNTYQLDPKRYRKFSPPVVKKKIVDYLERNAQKIQDGVIDSRKAAQQIRDIINKLKFDRYRIGVVVTVGRLDQYNGFNQDLQSLWDGERDGYQFHVFRSPQQFILVLCFGIYRD